MTINDFLDSLIQGRPLERTVFSKDEKVEDLFAIASSMLPCSSKSILLAFCYAKGYGVEKDLSQFESILLSALKYQDFRVYLWLIRAYTNGLHLGEETIKIEGKEEEAKKLIELSNPLVANYYNTLHGYKTADQIREIAARKKAKDELEAAARKEVAKKKRLLLEKMASLSKEEVEEAIDFMKGYQALDISFLGEALEKSVECQKSLAITRFLFDELVAVNGGYQTTENTRYFPIGALIHYGHYDMALELLKLCEDMDCTFKTSAWVYLNEGICLYGLHRYEEALTKLSLADDDEDYWEEVGVWTKRIGDAMKNK